MEKEQIYEEIAKNLSAVNLDTNNLIIKAEPSGVQVITCKGYIICGYILEEIHDITKKLGVHYYVGSDLNGNPYVIIHK